MTLALLVAAKNTGTFGTFEVTEGNVSKNKKQLLMFFNETTALVPMDARAQFTTPDEHAAFDGALMGLPAVGVSIQYIDSVAKFMNPEARFKEFLSGDLIPASVGLKLTAEELAVPSAYETAKAKFVALFTAPTPPREFDQRELREEQKLRVYLRGSEPYQIGNGSYKMGYKSAQTLWEHKLNKKWANRPAVESSMAISDGGSVTTEGYNRNVMIYTTRIEIGCQTIQRNQIEELAQRMGWTIS